MTPTPPEPTPTASDPLRFGDSELVFGIVCAVGTDYAPVAEALNYCLRGFGYRPVQIKLSQFAAELGRVQVQAEPEFDRIRSHMDAGNAARRASRRNDILALAAAGEISKHRQRGGDDRPKPRARTAYILLTLKRPEEAQALRAIYGPGFFLVSVFSSQSDRLEFLVKTKSVPAEQARELLDRDADERDEFGQRTTEAFQLADVFVEASQCKPQIQRLLDLIFGAPFITPNLSEYAMFMAYAASVRSAQLGRQVGAALAAPSGEVLALGCNDVPRFGGGLYWPTDGDSDRRDHVLGYDSNDSFRREIESDVLKKLEPHLKSEPEQDLLASSQLSDITEFGRAVHAEMDAILSAARFGISPRGTTLYTTTFPCHNCTRHIITAGIVRVVYVEPYEKSKAEALHGDSIAIAAKGGAISACERVEFVPFAGIGPRRYIQLFSVRLGAGLPQERKRHGKIIVWQAGPTCSVRAGMQPNSYLEQEQVATSVLSKAFEMNQG